MLWLGLDYDRKLSLLLLLPAPNSWMLYLRYVMLPLDMRCCFVRGNQEVNQEPRSQPKSQPRTHLEADLPEDSHPT
jgi:hypothetical protein